MDDDERERNQLLAELCSQEQHPVVRVIHDDYDGETGRFQVTAPEIEQAIAVVLREWRVDFEKKLDLYFHEREKALDERIDAHTTQVKNLLTSLKKEQPPSSIRPTGKPETTLEHRQIAQRIEDLQTCLEKHLLELSTRVLRMENQCLETQERVDALAEEFAMATKPNVNSVQCGQPESALRSFNRSIRAWNPTRTPPPFTSTRRLHEEGQHKIPL